MSRNNQKLVLTNINNKDDLNSAGDLISSMSEPFEKTDKNSLGDKMKINVNEKGMNSDLTFKNNTPLSNEFTPRQYTTNSNGFKKRNALIKPKTLIDFEKIYKPEITFRQRIKKFLET